MRSRLAPILLLLAGLGLPARPGEPADPPPQEEHLEAYAEWRQGDLLVVDGQRVRLGAGGRFKGDDEARDVSSVPLGYEVEVRASRLPDGSLLAREIEARPNGSALFEKQVLSLTDQAERDYRQRGFFFQKGRDGKLKPLGRLQEKGADVDRLRRIVDRLAPPYLPEDRVRVYVIENKDWNAMAMGNYSIYAYSGLLKELDDDELAIVLGHELAHATHEHTRRQFKKQMWIQMAALGVSAAAREIDDRKKRAVAQVFTAFAALAWRNGYGRDLEDQADRVGLRYAYEGGYDVSRGPGLWRRFAKKYGEKGKVVNFFFANHSLSSARAANLERELERNYRPGPPPLP